MKLEKLRFYLLIFLLLSNSAQTNASGINWILYTQSQVFLKYWHVDHLNMCLENFISNLRVVQTTIQMYLARSKFLEMLKYINYCKDQVFTIGNAVTKTGDQLFHILMSTNDLDKQHYRQRVSELPFITLLYTTMKPLRCPFMVLMSYKIYLPASWRRRTKETEYKTVTVRQKRSRTTKKHGRWRLVQCPWLWWNGRQLYKQPKTVRILW